MNRGRWERVTRSKPCPVCGKPDWCVHAENGTVCARVESGVRVGSAGWLHPSGDAPRVHVPTWRRVEEAPDVGETADRLYLSHHAAWARGHLAQRLGVSEAALDRLRVGWNLPLRAWTFPMRDGRGRVVGIQNRFAVSGGKQVVRGHRAGVFEPAELAVEGRELVVCEGASDTAAALSIGLEAIGRFSCTGTVDEIVARVRRHRPSKVLIVVDNDAPGIKGGEQLAAALDGIALVETRTPPAGIKDLRAWTQSGATAAQIKEGAA